MTGYRSERIGQLVFRSIGNEILKVKLRGDPGRTRGDAHGCLRTSRIFLVSSQRIFSRTSLIAAFAVEDVRIEG